MERVDADTGGVTGIVLAGGAGSRLGAPKASVRLGGVTLVERAVAALAERCDEVIVVTRAGVALPPLAATVLVDRPGPAAPIVAVATGLASARSEACLVLGCDLPFAPPALDRLPVRGGVATAPSGLPQPLCARYPRVAALAACEALIAADRLALLALVAALGLPHVPATETELLNINTPDDVARAKEILAAQAGSTSTTAL